MRPSQLVLSATLTAALGLVGCGGPIGGPVPDLTASAPTPPAPLAADAAQPQTVDIPALSAHSTLIPLGIQGVNGVPVTPPSKAGEVEVPDVHHPLQAGWVQVATDKPGMVAPLVVLAHVDGDGHPGLFVNLKTIPLGAKVTVDYDSGPPRTFTIVRTRKVPKAEFPTADVYGPTATPEIRLVTCGGTFDHAKRSYIDSIIAYGVLTP